LREPTSCPPPKNPQAATGAAAPEMSIRNRLARNPVSWVALAALLVLAILAVVYREALLLHLAAFFRLVTDRERLVAFVQSWGLFAPVVFVVFQVLQVIFAPFPGEATGFIGGYLFGAAKGFVYSSIGLTVGSLANFMIGRVLGKRYIRHLIPKNHLKRFDTFVKHQGVIVIFILFVIPGFPKDYLCLFLGLSRLPVRVLLLIAAVGRMPGTLLLSLQGAMLYEQNYTLLAVVFAATFLLVGLAYRFRENLYRWVERYNHNRNSNGGGWS
jgi:uncharacterized membrane protein YdjX (TVP38/TMEM64 family)